MTFIIKLIYIIILIINIISLKKLTNQIYFAVNLDIFKYIVNLIYTIYCIQIIIKCSFLEL